MRVLGIDYGSKRIGVSLGDTDSRLASPWCVIENDLKGMVWERIMKLVQEEQIALLVVGVPRPLHDREHENQQVRETRVFIDGLQKRGMRVEEMDETLSSRMAETFVRDRGEKGKRDDLAATVILQSWLDKR